ncbi:hypothetical protein AMAG_08630 [Allomyces macrogynus ATCC 38327]|uniref:Uncharacterized protein n=1 Tax=Allomyces macrogynus (strain ATCC 38327) TaxID=578462 RepID=A0A0L0SM35_ALLM3|nr:hypothetical protein AMAG_08630 [Allomyces macrogynus ATCC 38327]|eukprot:KNE63508.1 hypothetical protein AMAG_08630 [Allomyces macrogynus ATCC 38327]
MPSLPSAPAPSSTVRGWFSAAMTVTGAATSAATLPARSWASRAWLPPWTAAGAPTSPPAVNSAASSDVDDAMSDASDLDDADEWQVVVCHMTDFAAPQPVSTVPLRRLDAALQTVAHACLRDEYEDDEADDADDESVDLSDDYEDDEDLQLAPHVRAPAAGATTLLPPTWLDAPPTAAPSRTTTPAAAVVLPPFRSTTPGARVVLAPSRTTTPGALPLFRSTTPGTQAPAPARPASTPPSTTTAIDPATGEPRARSRSRSRRGSLIDAAAQVDAARAARRAAAKVSVPRRTPPPPPPSRPRAKSATAAAGRGVVGRFDRSPRVAHAARTRR